MGAPTFTMAQVQQMILEAQEQWAWPPEVHFKRHRVPPPPGAYIGPDDHLQVSIFTTASTTNLVLNYRYLHSDGSMQYASENLDGVSLSTLTTKIFKLCEGWLMGLSVSNLGGGLADQTCYVIVGLQAHGRTSTPPHTILAQGYVSNLFTVDWPPSYVRGPAPVGNGDIYRSVVTLTAAQILTLFATPVQIAPAPGANLIINPFAQTLTYKFGTTAYTLTGGSQIIYGYSSAFAFTTAIINCAGLLDQTHDVIFNSSKPYNHNSTRAQIVNLALFLGMNTGAATLGDGTLEVVTNYSIDPVT